MLADVKPVGEIRLATGENSVGFTSDAGEATSSRAEVTFASRGDALANDQRVGQAPRETRDERLRLVAAQRGGHRIVRGAYERAPQAPPQSIPAFDGAGNVWEVRNHLAEPYRAAVVISRSGAMPDVDYDDAQAVVLEDFEDLTTYDMSERNQFEQFVIGGGKQLTDEGPVRAGVSQTFESSAEGARAGGPCGVYSAANDGGPSGWCAKGKRFAAPVDLSGHSAIALWLHGDGKGEQLRLQLRDSSGAHADWIVPIAYTGWRLQVFATADVVDFDWSEVAYVLFYFNGIPAATQVSLRLDDLKAIPELAQPRSLARPVITIGDRRVKLPATVGPNDAVTIDADGRLALWRGERRERKALKARGPSLVLKPGANRIQLDCDRADEAPRDVVVDVLHIEPVD